MSKVIRLNEMDIKRIDKLKEEYINSIESETIKDIFKKNTLSEWVSISILDALRYNGIDTKEI